MTVFSNFGKYGIVGAAGGAGPRWPYDDGLTVIAVPGIASQYSVATSFTDAITTSVGGNPSYGSTNGIDFDGSGDKVRFLHSADGFDIASSQDFVIQFEYILDETPL